MMRGMPDQAESGVFVLQCPCCNAELTVDAATRSILHHSAQERSAPITDLAAEVAKLKEATPQLERRFERSLAAERNKTERLDRQFEELLRRARKEPES